MKSRRIKSLAASSFVRAIKGFFLSVLVLTATCLSFSARGQAAHLLKRHLPESASQLPPQGRLEATNSLRLAVSLPLRDTAGLAALLQHLYDPRSPDFHRFLTPSQFSARFGPTAKDYESVVSWAKSNGLHVIAKRDSRMLLDLQGGVPEVEKAFRVSMRKFQHPSEPRLFYAPDSAPSVPAELPILGVAGLENYAAPHSMLHHIARKRGPVASSGSQSSGYLLGTDFRNAYAPGVALTGAGQIVGLLELDGYYASDIVAYENLAGLPNVPLQNIVVAGPMGTPGNGDPEVSLDIEMAIAMAPGLASVAVFEASSSSGIVGFEDIFDSMASSNQIKQFSSSWGYTGVPDPDSVVDSMLQKMVAQGQTFCQASGDGDCWNTTRFRPMELPVDSVYLTSVGGTSLSMNGRGASYLSESVWNEGNLGAGNGWALNGNGYVGSGGGVSTIYSIPSWQQGVHTSANSASISMRNVPDMAMTANSIWITFNNGSSGAVGGTSCAAPLLAGFIALANQQAAAAGNPSVGFINPAIYTLGSGSSYSTTFHDITSGNNTNAGSHSLYFAAQGYDLCTGLGTPNGQSFINALTPEPLQITPPATLAFSGLSGGPFTPSAENLVLTNIAPLPLNWSCGATASWLSVSVTNGSLSAGGASTTVVVSVGPSAASLSAGVYSGTLLFTNLNDGQTQIFQASLTISQTAPMLTWTNPAPVTYGNPLSANQLNASANVPGTFVYNPAAGSILNAGTNSLSVTFTPTDLTTYAVATNAVSLVVWPAPLTVTASNASRLFGQTNPIFTGSIVGLQNNDNISASFSCTATTNNAAGIYPIVPSLIDPANRRTNYSVTLVNGSLTVTLPPLQITWTNPQSVTYGTPLGSNQLNASANIAGNFSYIPQPGTVLTTGTNALSAIFVPTDTNDYNSVTNSVNLIVKPATLTVTAANTNRAFGVANPTLTGTIAGLSNADNITATYSCSAGLANSPGAYAIVPALIDPSNLQSNYTVHLVNGTLTVTQATPLVTWTNPPGIIYGSALTSNQLDAMAGVPGSFSYNPPGGAILPSGSNLLSVVFTPSDTADYQSVTTAVSIVIGLAQLNVIASNAARGYGQTNPIFSGALLGLQGADNITASFVTTATSNSPVGAYSIAPQLVDPANKQTNYTVNFTNGTLIVTQGTPTLLWTNPTAISYGTALSSNQLNATASTVGSFNYSPAPGIVLPAGTNALSLVFTPADSTNYVSISDSVNLLVTPAPLAVLAASLTRLFGQTNPAFSGSISGLQNGDNIAATYASSASSNSPVGIYAVVPTVSDPSNRLGNYALSVSNGFLTVLPATPLVVWTNPSPIIYGSAIGTNQLNAVASVTGSFVYSPTNGTVLSAGTNTLSAVFNPSDTTNYASVTNYSTLIVAPASLFVNVSNASRSYGLANPAFTGSITGLTNGDDITASFATAAGSNSPVGTYPITASLIDPANRQTNYSVVVTNGILAITQAVPQLTWSNPPPLIYGAALGSNQLNAISSVGGTFAYSPASGTVLSTGINSLSVVFTPSDAVDYGSVTNSVVLLVARAPLNIVASNYTRSYGQPNPLFAGSLAGIRNGDNITVTYSCAATTNSPTGNYAIIPTLIDPANRQTNYTLSVSNGVLAIAAAAPLVSWTNPAPITYGAALGSNQLNASANVPGSFAYTPSNGMVLNSGTNTLSVAFAPVDSANYSGATNSATLVVSPAPLIVTASNATRSYAQTNPVFTGSVNGLMNGDVLGVSFISTADTNSPVGTYSITPLLSDPTSRGTNYVIQLIAGNLIITQALPQLTWSSPGPVTYGTALSSNQLNATANIAGTFQYTPAAGAVLAAGTNILSVAFTPLDALDYSPASANVQLLVTANAIPLNVQLVGNAIVLNWSDPASSFVLQSAPAVTGVFTNVPGASSPFTNILSGPGQFFRLTGH
jgi:hypothetical protein